MNFNKLPKKVRPHMLVQDKWKIREQEEILTGGKSNYTLTIGTQPPEEEMTLR